MSKATPRPWKLREVQAWDHDLEAIGRIEGANKNKVADCRYYTSTSVKSEEHAIADAELIVRAVNRDHLFDDLINEVQELLKDGCLSNLSFQKRKNLHEICKKAKGE